MKTGKIALAIYRAIERANPPLDGNYEKIDAALTELGKIRGLEEIAATALEISSWQIAYGNMDAAEAEGAAEDGDSEQSWLDD